MSSSICFDGCAIGANSKNPSVCHAGIEIPLVVDRNRLGTCVSLGNLLDVSQAIVRREYACWGGSPRGRPGRRIDFDGPDQQVEDGRHGYHAHDVERRRNDPFHPRHTLPPSTVLAGEPAPTSCLDSRVRRARGSRFRRAATAGILHPSLHIHLHLPS